jgi:hypothetical protein
MIGRIKNIWLRRLLLLLVAVPVTLALMAFEAMLGIFKGYDEAADAIGNAWSRPPQT